MKHRSCPHVFCRGYRFWTTWTQARFLVFVLIAVMGVVAVSGTVGCSRTWHRRRANQEVRELVETVGCDARWQLSDYSICADPKSRYFDPFNPDCEPMPQDDCAAHQYMQRVYGMKHGKMYGKNGCTDLFDNPAWRQYLHIDGNGELLLDKDTTVELALIHSPAYRREMEALYFSALNVSLSRFAFDTHFVAKESLFYTADGKLRGGDTTLKHDPSVSVSKKFATGGTFLVGLANSMTWQFAGIDSYKTNSLLNFNLVQPLLRGAGRDIVLENLTFTERQFLSQVRSFARYRQSFYIDTVFSARSNGGYLGLLSRKVQIQNQRQNLIQLEDNLNRMLELFDVGKTNAFQVETTRLSFLESQNRYITLLNDYQNQVETYLTGTLGLPPDLRVNVSDPLLEQFELMAPSLLILQRDTQSLQGILQDDAQPIPTAIVAELNTIQTRAEGELDLILRDFERLQAVVPQRETELNLLRNRPEIQNGDVSASICDVNGFRQRVENRRAELPVLKDEFDDFFRLIRLFSQYNRQQLTAKIATEQFDRETLITIYRLEMLELLPRFQQQVQAIRTKYINSYSEVSRQRRDAARDVMQLELARRNASLPEERREQVESQLLRAREVAAQIDVKRNELMTKIDTEVSELIDQHVKNSGETRFPSPSFDTPLPIPVPAPLPTWVNSGSTESDDKNTDITPISAPDFTAVTAADMAADNTVTDSIDDSTDDSTPRSIVPQDPYRLWLKLIVKRFYNELLVMSIVQSRIRLDSITLEPIDISPDEAVAAAKTHRLDWMNERSKLVDSWRKIDVAANDLRSLLNVRFSGSLGTNENDPFRFTAENGQLAVGLEWDSPLSRKSEENVYVRSLVEYQQARRAYYQYVDSVQLTLRNMIRTVRSDQLNFEIQRSSIFVSIIKVDLAQLELTRPPKSGGRSDQLSENVAKNLVDALQELLRGQNSILDVWVGYQQRRLNLELDMGILQLDGRGHWVNIGPLNVDTLQKMNSTAN